MHRNDQQDFNPAPELEALASLGPQIQQLSKEHVEKRKPWYAETAFLQSLYYRGETQTDRFEMMRQLSEQAKALPDLIRVCLITNIVTEDGIVQFPRALANSFGKIRELLNWLDIWSAEERGHGLALNFYCLAAGIFKPGSIEKLAEVYVNSGFHPPWEHRPFETFAYTTLQERATQVSHDVVGKLAGEYEPVIARILGYIKRDEAWHYHVYREILKLILGCDPNRALAAIAQTMRKMHMPGITIPGYENYTEAFEQLNVYTLGSLAKIIEEVNEKLGIGKLCNLNDEGHRAQDRIMKTPETLRGTWERYKKQRTQKSFTPEFLDGRTVSITPALG